MRSPAAHAGSRPRAGAAGGALTLLKHSTRLRVSIATMNGPAAAGSGSRKRKRALWTRAAVRDGPRGMGGRAARNGAQYASLFSLLYAGAFRTTLDSSALRSPWVWLTIVSASSFL